MPDVLVWSFNKIKKEVVLDKDIQINDITADKNITFKWKLLSGHDILEKVQIKKDDNNWQTIGKNTAFSWTNIDKGIHTFKVRAVDNKENYSNEIEWSFNKLDTIQISKKHSEPNEKTNKTNILFEWTINNGALQYCEIRKDNGSWEQIGIDTFYEWNNISEEHHTFEVKATDTLNEESNILKWDFEVIESVSIVLPQPITFDNIINGVTSSTSFETSWCISKSSNIFNLIDKFEVRIDGLITGDNVISWTTKYISKIETDGAYIDEDGTIHSNETTEQCWLLSIPSSLLNAGEHSIEIRVVDIFGISHMLYSEIFTIIDFINIIKLKEMTNNKIIEDNYTFTWTLNKGKLNYYEIQKDNGNWEKINNANYKWNGIDKKLHTFKVKAIDILENQSNILEWNFERVDSISISKLNDINAKSNNKSLEFKWKLNNGILDYYKIQKDNDSWEKINTTNYNWDNIPTGHRMFKVYAVDSLGNRSDILTWDFEIIEGVEIEKNVNISGEVLKNSLEFKWKITKGSDALDRLKIQKDNTGIWEDIGVKASYTWNDILSTGDHSFKVKAIDMFNNESNTLEWTFNKPDIIQLEKANNPTTDIKQDYYTFKWTLLGDKSRVKRYEIRKNDGSWEWVTDTLMQYKWEDILQGKNILEIKAILNNGDESENILKWEFWNGTRLKWKYGNKANSTVIVIYEESYNDASFDKSFYYCTFIKDKNPTLTDLKLASDKTTKSLGIQISYTYGSNTYGYVWGYDNNNKITNILRIDHQARKEYSWANASRWEWSDYITNDYFPPIESDNIKLEKTNDPRTDIAKDNYTFTWNIINNAFKLKRYEVKLNDGVWEWYEDTSNTYKWEDIPKGKNKLEIKAIGTDESNSNILTWEFYNGIGLLYRYGSPYGSHTLTQFIVYEESYFNEPFITSVFYVEFDKTITPTMDDLNNNKTIYTLNKGFNYSPSAKYGYIWGYDENNRITNILKTDLSVYIRGYYDSKWSDKIYNSYELPSS